MVPAGQEDIVDGIEKIGGVEILVDNIAVPFCPDIVINVVRWPAFVQSSDEYPTERHDHSHVIRDCRKEVSCIDRIHSARQFSRRLKEKLFLPSVFFTQSRIPEKQDVRLYVAPATC